MATYNKFNLFTQDVLKALHNMTGASPGTYKVLLTNTAPVATNHLYGDISGTELANGNGYTTGGTTTTISDSSTSGTEKILATNVVFTATGSMGPFRYAVIYRSDSTNKEMVGWYDYGSSVTLNAADTFTVNFDATNGFFTVT